MRLQLQSNFALLDVKRGRASLLKKLQGEVDNTVGVVIRGSLVRAWSCDDGESQEFEVIVESVEVTK